MSSQPAKVGRPAALTVPENRKRMQEFLGLYLHARSCHLRENQAKEPQCNVPQCKIMKNILNHVSTCQAGKICKLQYCRSSKYLIGHFKSCTRADCPVCPTVKQIYKNRLSDAAVGTQPHQPSVERKKKINGKKSVRKVTRGVNDQSSTTDHATMIHREILGLSESREELLKTIKDAHIKTDLPSSEIHPKFRESQVLDIKLMDYRNMTQEQVWRQGSEMLAETSKIIVEFAKLIPSFMKLSQNDQVVLLKHGAFELAIIRLSKYIDLSASRILFENLLLKPEAFFTESAADEKLIEYAYDIAKSIAEVKLTHTELGLYSALILFSSADQPELKSKLNVRRLFESVIYSLKVELDRNHPQTANSVMDTLITNISKLKEVSKVHLEALSSFRQSYPHHEFPQLHQELFTLES